MKRVLILLLASVFSSASAWDGFVDDFEGDRLGGQWRFEFNPKGRMYYSVHDSLLDVFSFGGFAPRGGIYTYLPDLEDFELRARVGWSDDPHQQAMSIWIGGVDGRATAYMTYFRGGYFNVLQNVVWAGFQDGPSRIAPAPPEGFHEFRLRRRGSTYFAYLDGTLFLTGEGSRTRGSTLRLSFSGRTYQPAHLLVDRVSVVPEPTSVAALTCALGGMVLLRRRREC